MLKEKKPVRERTLRRAEARLKQKLPIVVKGKQTTAKKLLVELHNNAFASAQLDQKVAKQREVSQKNVNKRL